MRRTPNCIFRQQAESVVQHKMLHNNREETPVNSRSAKGSQISLLEQQIEVHTDHENLTYKTLNSRRVTHWKLNTEAYSHQSRERMSSSSTHFVGLRLEQNHSIQAFFTEELRSVLYCHSAETLTSSHYKLKYEQIQQAQLINQQVFKEETNKGPILDHSFQCKKQNQKNVLVLVENTAPKEAEATPWDKLCVDPIGPKSIRHRG